MLHLVDKPYITMTQAEWSAVARSARTDSEYELGIVIFKMLKANFYTELLTLRLGEIDELTVLQMAERVGLYDCSYLGVV